MEWPRAVAFHALDRFPVKRRIVLIYYSIIVIVFVTVVITIITGHRHAAVITARKIRREQSEKNYASTASGTKQRDSEGETGVQFAQG